MLLRHELNPYVGSLGRSGPCGEGGDAGLEAQEWVPLTRSELAASGKYTNNR